MNKTLYIHIGTGKTGSTALQEFLVTNEKLLSQKHGIKYCTTGRAENKHRALDYNARRKDLLADIKVKELLKELDEEIIDSSEHTFIVSDEDFPGLTYEEIESYRHIIRASIEIKIIVYLRRQDTYVESWLSQVVKTGLYQANFKDLLEQLEREKYLDYFSLLNNWAAVYGESNIVVRPYEKESFIGGNIFSDFMNIFNLGVEGFELPQKDINPSLSRDKVFLLRKLSDAGLGYLITDEYIRELTLVKEEVGDSKFVSSPSTRNELLNKYKASNDKVANLYLSQDFLFENTDIPTDWHNRLVVPDCLFLWSISYFIDKGKIASSNGSA